MNHQTMLYAAVGFLAVLGVLALLSGSRRKAKQAARLARDTGRAVSLLGRALVAAGVIVALQWAVITYTHNLTLTLAVLGGPALLSGWAAARAMTLTPITIQKGR